MAEASSSGVVFHIDAPLAEGLKQWRLQQQREEEPAEVQKKKRKTGPAPSSKKMVEMARPEATEGLYDLERRNETVPRPAHRL